MYLCSAASPDQTLCSSGNETTPNWDQSDERGPVSIAAGPCCAELAGNANVAEPASSSNGGSGGSRALREACSATSDPTRTRVCRKSASFSRCSGDTRPGRAPGCGCPAPSSPPPGSGSSAIPGAMVVHRRARRYPRSAGQSTRRPPPCASAERAAGSAYFILSPLSHARAFDRPALRPFLLWRPRLWPSAGGPRAMRQAPCVHCAVF